jgi:uncharacterized protein YuzE
MKVIYDPEVDVLRILLLGAMPVPLIGIDHI